MSLILQVNNAGSSGNSGGGGGGVNPPPSSSGPPPPGRITLSKPPMQVAIATAVKHHHHHPLLETHFLPQGGPPTTLRMPFTLPRPGLPLPPRHLPTTPLPLAQHRIRGLPKGPPPPGHCIMVNPSASRLAMLPQAPAGLLPSSTGPAGLISTTVGLIPIPRVQLQSLSAVPSNSSLQCTPPAPAPPPHNTVGSLILPPNTLHHQLFPPPKNNEEDSSDELDVAEPEVFNSRSSNNYKRICSPKSRCKNRPMALQDHNYASIPLSPPTPPPPPVVAPPPLPAAVAAVASIPPPVEAPEERQGVKPLHPEFLGQETVASTTVCSSSSSSLPSSRAAPLSPVVSRTQANLNSIQEAGVGPMVPLVEEDSASVSSGDDKGEETETAPEAEEAEDDSITRCICDFLHDDGYMICCDKCSVWQHVVCMGLDRNNIPDEYLCEVCKPRQIDRKRAKSLQARRRTEIFKNSSSSDDEHNENKNSSLSNKRSGGSLSKKLEKKSGGALPPLPNDSSKVSFKRQKTLKKSSSLEGGVKDSTSSLGSKVKKNYRKKKNSSSGSSNSGGGGLHHNNNSIKKITRRRANSSYPDDAEDDYNSEFDPGDDLEPKFESGQQLRSWIDQYEEAVTNHYSPELRARLSGHKNGSGELRPSAISAPTKCTVSLQGNGIKILTANCNISSNTPIIECKGRIMLSSQYRTSKDQEQQLIPSSPHVLFYRISEFLEIVVDGKTYGNDSRFCRRSSTNPNAELRHVVDKGSLHIFIVTTRSLEKYQEILLPSEARRLPRLNGIQDDVREIRGRPSLRSQDEENNGDEDEEEDTKENIGGESSSPPPSSRRKKRNSERSRKTFTRSSAAKNTRRSLKPKSEEDEKPPLTNGGEEVMLKEDSAKEEDGGGHEDSSPSSKALPKNSPNKLGLPDNSGLIVGVNTINYDASSSLRNKSKSREERKMEMIMKAIEAMEKAEQRKKETGDVGTCAPGVSGGGNVGLGEKQLPTKRRRSSSVKMSNVDSTLELSSADESKSLSENTVPNSRKVRKKSSSSRPPDESLSPTRRRALSGGCSADEHPSSGGGTVAGGDQFRFPKTKKMIMSDWLNQGEENDDDVSGSYLRGSRSPPGIATHLLRSAPLSPVKSVCSAKKRWLRQAISEDHSESSSKKDDSSVTPLKKRRLAHYKEEEQSQHSFVNEEETLPPTTTKEENEDPGGEEEAEESSSSSNSGSSKVVPSALKKKLLQNLVLEAVLDSAMEDMLSNVPKSEGEEESPVVPLKEEEHQEEEKATPPKTEGDALKSEGGDTPKMTIKKEEGEEHIKVEKNEAEEDMIDVKEEPIKTPEPASAFKSFFKSSVSLEDLEAELEASRRMREESANKDEEHPSCAPPSPKEEEDHHPPQQQPITVLSSSEHPPSKAAPPASSSKPKEKKRVSLADYKRRRKQGSVPPSSGDNNSSSPSTPTTPNVPLALPPSLCPNTQQQQQQVDVVSALPPPTHLQQQMESDEPGTPTLDEDVPVSMPTLNTLPLFEKLEQLEKAQRENCKKKVASTMDLSGGSGSNACSSSLANERKREDLTERLKKEFGLVVEDNHHHPGVGEEALKSSAPDGDATPESSSPVPPAAAPARFGTSFTPTQYPSYPSNYPLPPYPASKTAAAPHPPPNNNNSQPSNSHHHSSRRSSDYYSHSGGPGAGASTSSSSSSRNSYYSSSSRTGRYRDYRDYREKDHHHHHHSSSSSHRSSSRNYRSNSSYYP